MPTLPQSPARRNPPRKPPSGVQGRTFALVRELRLLIETTRALASAHEPKSVLRVIFDKAKAFVRCEAWSLFLIEDRKSTRLNSSHGYISYAVFCLKKKNNTRPDHTTPTL